MYFPAGINQGLAAALRAPPSGLFIALVIQIPAVTALGGDGGIWEECFGQIWEGYFGHIWEKCFGQIW